MGDCTLINEGNSVEVVNNSRAGSSISSLRPNSTMWKYCGEVCSLRYATLGWPRRSVVILNGVVRGNFMRQYVWGPWFPDGPGVRC